MEYFKDKLFPEIFKSFLAIFTLWVGSSFKKSLEKSDTTFFSFDFSPFVNISLYLLYLVFFFYFGWKAIQILRTFLVSHIEKMQEDYSSPTARMHMLEMDNYYVYRKYNSFIFRVEWGDLNAFTPDYLLGISEPKCAIKDCHTDLSFKHSYLGFYKYRCPACKKKYVNKYRPSTLKANLKSVIGAEFEKESDKLFS